MKIKSSHHFKIITYIILLYTTNVFCQINLKTGDKSPEITITDYISNTPKLITFKNKLRCSNNYL